MTKSSKDQNKALDLDRVAANGLLSRRHLLSAALGGAGLAMAGPVIGQEPGIKLEIPAWSKTPGPGTSPYGSSSAHARLERQSGFGNPLYPGGGASRSPLQHLQGTITPNSLHFERHHAGIPAIDPAGHKLVIHGLVRQPLMFDYEDLLKYQMVSKIHFLECSGNSGALLYGGNPDGTAQSLHGLVSCAEWTGIPLSVLLEEAGVLPEARWARSESNRYSRAGRRNYRLPDYQAFAFHWPPPLWCNDPGHFDPAICESAANPRRRLLIPCANTRRQFPQGD